MNEILFFKSILKIMQQHQQQQNLIKKIVFFIKKIIDNKNIHLFFILKLKIMFLLKYKKIYLPMRIMMIMYV